MSAQIRQHSAARSAGGDRHAPGGIALRPAARIMRLSRMGSFHQSRLSFLRVLLRRLKQQQWRFSRPIWEIDDNGVGIASYRAQGPERCYTLLAFAHDLPAEHRSDRVIAQAWDATFTLFDGDPTRDDIQRLQANVPLQEAGRISDNELTLSRANRSVRLFQYVIDRLSKGQQPDLSDIDPVGYLMRTTAVYGSGKFGAADREKWAQRPEFEGSFQPEMLTVWLIRSFTLDLVEHLARTTAPTTAVQLAPDIRRRFGVGNSTGLGMAPFLMTHPALIHSWVCARETALLKVRSIAEVTDLHKRQFMDLLKRARLNANDWTSKHAYQLKRIENLREDLTRLCTHLQRYQLSGNLPWNQLYLWAEQYLGEEAQEQLVSLLLEPYPELVDALANTMTVNENSVFNIDGSMTLGELKRIYNDVYRWALDTDFSVPEHVARIWYVSEEKLEPRLGERFEEPLEPYEQALAPGRDAALTYAAIQRCSDDATAADFLSQYPQHRQSIRRAQLASKLPYAEIYDNTIDAKMLPIDLLRCKLSFFGATRFDPRSDRWVRITLFQGAPFPAELQTMDPDEFAYPPLPVGSPE